MGEKKDWGNGKLSFIIEMILGIVALVFMIKWYFFDSSAGFEVIGYYLVVAGIPLLVCYLLRANKLDKWSRRDKNSGDE